MNWIPNLIQRDDVIPRILPDGWMELKINAPMGICIAGRTFKNENLGIAVIVTVEELEDSDDKRQWLHVSLSRANKLPGWKDIQLVKDIFIGKDKTAIQVLPPADEHVNVHQFCMHLWCCLNEKIIPDFRREGQI